MYVYICVHNIKNDKRERPRGTPAFFFSCMSLYYVIFHDKTNHIVVWVPAPSQEEEGSGTLRISDLFFTPHGHRGATIECESVVHTYCDENLRKCVHSIAIPIPIIRVLDRTDRKIGSSLCLVMDSPISALSQDRAD